VAQGEGTFNATTNTSELLDALHEQEWSAAGRSDDPALQPQIRQFPCALSQCLPRRSQLISPLSLTQLIHDEITAGGNYKSSDKQECQNVLSGMQVPSDQESQARQLGFQIVK
jgi:hypothetical protein